MAFHKNIHEITGKDLKSLVTNQVEEDKTVEYKLELPAKDHDSKKEFLADVSSFANAQGGFLFFGIHEEDGIPVDIPGLSGLNFDDEILRLESLLRDNIDPRIWGYTIRHIPIDEYKEVVVIHVPKSWNQPHVVNYQRHWRFYSRHSKGKYPLDVSELRSAFALSESLAERIRSFRAERLGKIISDNAPIHLSGNAKIIIHLVPAISLTRESLDFNIDALKKNPDLLKPIYAGGWNQRINFDGLLVFTKPSTTLEGSSYLQVFRNGFIEAVDEKMLGKQVNETPYIPSIVFERELIQSIKNYLEIQKLLGITPPIFIMISLLGVNDYVMATGQTFALCERIDRNELIIPEIMVEDFADDVNKILKPSIDVVWNAAGYPGSKNYDENGNWKPKR